MTEAVSSLERIAFRPTCPNKREKVRTDMVLTS